jgi:hypothetical protein
MKNSFTLFLIVSIVLYLCLLIDCIELFHYFTNRGTSHLFDAVYLLFLCSSQVSIYVIVGLIICFTPPFFYKCNFLFCFVSKLLGLGIFRSLHNKWYSCIASKLLVKKRLGRNCMNIATQLFLVIYFK